MQKNLLKKLTAGATSAMLLAGMVFSNIGVFAVENSEGAEEPFEVEEVLEDPTSVLEGPEEPEIPETPEIPEVAKPTTLTDEEKNEKWLSFVNRYIKENGLDKDFIVDLGSASFSSGDYPYGKLNEYLTSRNLQEYVLYYNSNYSGDSGDSVIADAIKAGENILKEGMYYNGTQIIKGFEVRYDADIRSRGDIDDTDFYESIEHNEECRVYLSVDIPDGFRLQSSLDLDSDELVLYLVEVYEDQTVGEKRIAEHRYVVPCPRQAPRGKGIYIWSSFFGIIHRDYESVTASAPTSTPASIPTSTPVEPTPESQVQETAPEEETVQEQDSQTKTYQAVGDSFNAGQEARLVTAAFLDGKPENVDAVSITPVRDDATNREFDITFQDAAGNVVKTNGRVLVTLPTGGREVDYVYHMVNGVAERVESFEQLDGYVRFVADDFSVYGMKFKTAKAEKTESSTKKEESKKEESKETKEESKETKEESKETKEESKETKEESKETKEEKKLPETGEKSNHLMLFTVLLLLVAGLTLVFRSRQQA